MRETSVGKHDDGKGPQEEDVKVTPPNFDQQHETGAHEADKKDGKK